MMYSVMCELTVVVATEHFSLQESYSVVVNNKPECKGVWSFYGSVVKTGVSLNKLPCSLVETAAVLYVEEAGSSET
jgi:hypothetical protein